MAGETGYSTVSKILILQFIVIVFVTLCYFILGTEHSVVSSALGGLTAFLPNLYFAYRMSLVKESGAKKIVRSFYSGETRKLLLTFSLFALVFQVPNVQFFTFNGLFCSRVIGFFGLR